MTDEEILALAKSIPFWEFFECYQDNKGDVEQIVTFALLPETTQRQEH